VGGGGGGGGGGGFAHVSPAPTSFIRQASGLIFKDDVNGFPSIMNIFCMARRECLV
jgi:hypothetical protein